MANRSGIAHAATGLVFPTKCGVCGLLDNEPLCDGCRALLNPLAKGPSLFHYSRVAGDTVRRLKYLRVTPLAIPMSDMLAERYRLEHEGVFDAVVPVPIHWSRRFSRGFNQAELLCAAFPKGLVQSRWLIRTKATKPQARLSPQERLSSLRGAFAARRIVAGKRILLIDDVITSGGTYTACHEALMKAGAAKVSILTFAGSGELSLP